MAAVEKCEERRKPEAFFGHRNRGRLRAPPGADKASKKEWQRSKNARKGVSPKHFSGTATGNGLDRSEHITYADEKGGMVKTIPYDGKEKPSPQR